MGEQQAAGEEQEQKRDEVSKIVGAEVPEGLSPQETKRLLRKALKPKATEVCACILFILAYCSKFA